MTFTFACCVLSSTYEPIGKFFKHPLTLIFSLILCIYSMCVIVFNDKIRRTVPQNYIYLLMVTIGEAFLLSATAADLKVASVYSAIFATCLAVVGLFYAAMKTASSVNRDVLIRHMCIALVWSFFAQIIMLLVMIFLYNPKDKWVVFGIGCFMVPLAGAYVMFALLFIIVPGIEDKDDYILGAMRLYLEIARLFFWLMKILGEKK
jgi:FtsH-binding integral membrane protein